MQTLIVTVGGSHQPIKKAIEDLKPEKVIFICSKDDAETGQKGSWVSVIGKDNVNKSRPGIEKPDLKNLVSLCQLPEQDYPEPNNLEYNSENIVLVTPDNLTEVYIEIEKVIKNIDHTEVVADYTGGTKTMTAALAMIATDYNLKLNLVVGTRADLVKVQNGSEESISIDLQQLRFLRNIKPITRLWSHYGYQQTQMAIEAIPVTVQNQNCRRLVAQLSRAFSAWDCFEHQQARNILEAYRNKIAKYYHYHLTVIKHLVDAQTDEKYTPYLIIDLWNNARRKASQGYYDDAIGRVYRMIEWTGQWLLKNATGWETADLPEEAKSEGISITRNRKGQNQAGLFAVWQLLSKYGNDQARDFIDKQLEALMNHVNIRNQSILAHGFTPVTQLQWESLKDWLEIHFIPMFIKQVQQNDNSMKLNIEKMQLPSRFEQKLFID